MLIARSLFDLASSAWAGVSPWEWIKALIVPLTIAGTGGYFAHSQKLAEVDVAQHNAQAATLQAYLAQMTEMLIDRNLRETEEKDDKRNVARGWTLAILPELNGLRKAIVLRFLYEARLIRRSDDDRPEIKQPIMSIELADLSLLEMPRAFLENANLTKVNFRDSNLRRATLVKADLTEADLTGADLTGANLCCANVTRAICSRKTLCGAGNRDGLKGQDTIKEPGSSPENEL